VHDHRGRAGRLVNPGHGCGRLLEPDRVIRACLEPPPFGVLSLEADNRDGTDMSSADKAKGKIKEALGSLTGSDDLRKEGQALQHKGHHMAQAAETHAVAEKHEREAELFEHEERYRQGT
jgi:uncharacterized protein YjbJ (UPF0337 family)